MKKTHLIILNIILLLWYFLSIIGLKIGDKYLVTGAFEEEWLFMLIPTITFVLMLVTKNVGRNIHLIWLAGWEESTIDVFLSIMGKAVKVSSKQTFQKC